MPVRSHIPELSTLCVLTAGNNKLKGPRQSCQNKYDPQFSVWIAIRVRIYVSIRMTIIIKVNRLYCSFP